MSFDEHIVYLSCNGADVNFFNARTLREVGNILKIDCIMDAFLFFILFFIIVNSAPEQYILRAEPTYSKNLGSHTTERKR
jgi:hypothetical protein